MSDTATGRTDRRAASALDPRRRRRARPRPSSTPPGPAGTGSDAGRSPPTAARATRPASACAIDRWVGDGDSLAGGGARGAARGGRPGRARRRPTRTRPTPSSRSWPRSTRARRESRSSARSAARGSTTRWRTSGCSPTRARRPPRPGSSTRAVARSGSCAVRRRSRSRRPHRRPRLAPAVRRRRRRRDDRRPALPAAATRRSSWGRPAACRTSASASDAR